MQVDCQVGVLIVRGKELDIVFRVNHIQFSRVAVFVVVPIGRGTVDDYCESGSLGEGEIGERELTKGADLFLEGVHLHLNIIEGISLDITDYAREIAQK